MYLNLKKERCVFRYFALNFASISLCSSSCIKKSSSVLKCAMRMRELRAYSVDLTENNLTYSTENVIIWLKTELYLNITYLL